MYSLAVLVTVCLASTVMTASVHDKPHYGLEDAENLFEDFVKKYQKTYKRQEYRERLEIFKKNLVDINSLNAKYSAIFDVSRFADLTPEERQQYRGFNYKNATVEKVKIRDSLVAAPDELDYRTQHVVSHVKNQGQCGSCYIFSALGNIEGLYAKKHNECLALSEGQVLDCLECGTCNGGLMEDVMQELVKRAGLMKEADYPYQPKKGTCQEDKSKVKARVLSGEIVDIADEEDLKQKLADLGPLAVALNSKDMDFYSSGILRPNRCVGRNLDHGVTLVGYGEDKGEQFWILKNSWGPGWGEKGFIRMLRGVKACRIGEYVVTATVG